MPLDDNCAVYGPQINQTLPVGQQLCIQGYYDAWNQYRQSCRYTNTYQLGFSQGKGNALHDVYGLDDDCSGCYQYEVNLGLEYKNTSICM